MTEISKAKIIGVMFVKTKLHGIWCAVIKFPSFILQMGTRTFRRPDISPTEILPTDISPTTRTFHGQDISPTDNSPTDNSLTDNSLTENSPTEIISIEIILPSIT